MGFDRNRVCIGDAAIRSERGHRREIRLEHEIRAVAAIHAKCGMAGLDAFHCT
jgi:hypothetical protein